MYHIQHVTCYVTYKWLIAPLALQNFYTLDIHRMAVGQGSGFIWDRAGHVITNYHVRLTLLLTCVIA
jgi:hypothetical protein